MTARTLAHKEKWRRTANSRRLVCLCGWPHDLVMLPGVATAKAFLAHIAEAKAQQAQAKEGRHV